MKLKFEYQKYHPLFGYCKMTPQTRDLGDYIFWVFKVQVTLWVK